MPAKKVKPSPKNTVVWVKAVEKPEEKAVVEEMLSQAEPVTSERTCECGKPVAEGQTYVCKDHTRAN